MEQIVKIFNLILTALQVGGGIGFVWCLMKAGYKCFWDKQQFSEAKGDIFRGLAGLILVLGAFKISDWIQTMVKF